MSYNNFYIRKNPYNNFGFGLGVINMSETTESYRFSISIMFLFWTIGLRFKRVVE